MLNPLYTAVSWVLLKWHALWALAFGDTSGVTWALSIAFLVMTVRLILFPLFVKQIHSQRAMQELQPKLKELQKKYKGDKETLQREMMALYKENGANPIAGCLPLVLQAPVFLSLFHVLRRLSPSNTHKSLYSWTTEQFDSASHARFLGAPISAHFNISAADLHKLSASATTLNVKIVTGVLIAVMVATTYLTQKQMMSRQAASGQPVDPQQQMIQRLMLYGIPASLLVSGSLFPLGVVIYWCTTNLWSMGQQFYVLRKLPPIGGVVVKPEDVEASNAAARRLAPKPGAKPSARKPSDAARKETITPQKGKTEKGEGTDGAIPGKSSPGAKPRTSATAAPPTTRNGKAGTGSRRGAQVNGAQVKGAQSTESQVNGAQSTGSVPKKSSKQPSRPRAGSTSNGAAPRPAGTGSRSSGGSAGAPRKPARTPDSGGQNRSGAPRKPRSR